MNRPLSSPDSTNEDIFARICHAIANDGYIVLPQVLPDELLNQLFVNLIELNPHDFERAGIGREEDFQKNRFVRQDAIHWLEPQMEFAQGYFAWMEELRLRLNRQLFLGLFDYESMFAHYPEGAFYKRHLDAFKGNTNRRLSTVLYLNPQWHPEDGGELLMYQKRQKTPFESVLPTYGTMVIFLSEQFPHEVLPAHRSRFSLTGWFRVNDQNPF
ncbi:MAG: 2OG-Fe(II) oxygenase [Gammaproteobacteria bacterium]|nr:2OG-Fe(II) oxygenase [Gammaproteobacteria bacterium]